MLTVRAILRDRRALVRWRTVRAIAIAEAAFAAAPPHLRRVYEMAAAQPEKHRAVIARFGRHAHRNAVLGRVSTPEEAAYIRDGVFPHQTRLDLKT